MKAGKMMDGIYYGPDSEITEFPVVTQEHRKACGCGGHCGTCCHRIHADDLNSPQRCQLALTWYKIAFWNNLKRREFSILATGRNRARQMAIDEIGIHPDSIIQIKEATN